MSRPRQLPLPLPTELIGECLSHCDPRTLSSAALASRTLQGEADPYLWQDVRLDARGSAKRTLYAVSRCPQRVQYVRSLCVDDPACEGDVVAALLELLPSLQSLELVNCGSDGMLTGGASEGGDGIPFPFRLQRLRIVRDAGRLHARDLEHFLSSQPSLRVLELPESKADSRRMERLAARAFADPSFLPHLETLVAPPQVLAACVYGRPSLRHLASSVMTFARSRNAQGDEYALGVNLVCSALRANKGSCNVVSLSIGTQRGYEALTILASVCPNLRSLELGMGFAGLTQFCRDIIEHRHQQRAPLLTHLTKFAIHLAMDDGARHSDIETVRKLERHLRLCFPRLVEYTTHARGRAAGPSARRSGN